MSLKPEHQSETHFLKRRISVDEFGWHVVAGSKVCEKFVGCNGNESLQIDGFSWIEKQQKGNNTTEKPDAKDTSRVPIRCWNLSVHDRATLSTLPSTRKQIMREAAGPTTASKTKLKAKSRVTS